jgi:hypothetical protein
VNPQTCGRGAIARAVTIHQLFSALFGGFIIGRKHIGPVDAMTIRP